MTMKPCLVCGQPSDGPRCAEHQLPPREYGTTPPERQPLPMGYDYRWRQLSKRARRIQPWCSDCGTTDDLTTDHSPEAWARKAAGKPIRLADVDVVCRACNARRGRARPDDYPSGDMTQGDDPSGGGRRAPRSGQSRGYSRPDKNSDTRLVR